MPRQRGIRARLAIVLVALVALTAVVLGVGASVVADVRLHAQALDDAAAQARFDLSSTIPGRQLPADPTAGDIDRSGLAETLVLRESEFVVAARSAGATSPWIIVRHIAPNIAGLIIVTSTLNVANVVVSEAVLSLLGLGIQPPNPSIGKMITEAIPYLESNPLQVFFPSAALMLIVLTISSIGDGLRDAFDLGRSG